MAYSHRLLGMTFIIQTDHQALKWLHNVKNPSSRLLCWRLRLEEFRYRTIEYIKGKENKVADCLSRLFPVKESKDSLLDLIDRNEIDIEGMEDALPDIEEIAVNTDTRDLHTPEPPEEPQAPYHVGEKNTDMASLVDNREDLSYDQVLHNAYLKWTTDRTTTRVIK